MSMILECEPMAKKRSETPVPTPEEGPRKQILTLRGRDVYKDWLVRFALSERADMADLVDDALVAYAKAKGFERPPMR
jgi:hypothetical protein